jgi:hypothetical protein
MPGGGRLEPRPRCLTTELFYDTNLSSTYTKQSSKISQPSPIHVSPIALLATGINSATNNPLTRQTASTMSYNNENYGSGGRQGYGNDSYGGGRQNEYQQSNENDSYGGGRQNEYQQGGSNFDGGRGESRRHENQSGGMGGNYQSGGGREEYGGGLGQTSGYGGRDDSHGGGSAGGYGSGGRNDSFGRQHGNSTNYGDEQDSSYGHQSDAGRQSYSQGQQQHGSSGGYGGSNDFSEAASHAQSHAGNKEDESLFTKALGMLSGKEDKEDLDEDDAVQQHRMFHLSSSRKFEDLPS